MRLRKATPADVAPLLALICCDEIAMVHTPGAPREEQPALLQERA